MEYNSRKRCSLSQAQLEQIVAEHTGLVKSVALRLSHVYGEEAEDLIQIGYIGLIKAAERFEPERGLKFSTYAVPLITGEIKSQLRDHGSLKVSRSIKSDAVKLRRAESEFVAENGRSPKISELSLKTGLGQERIVQVFQAADAMNNMEELDKPDIMSDPLMVTGEEEQSVTKMDLVALINTLEPKERQVMVLRYYKDMTQSQTADVMGTTQVQVCRIEKRALKNMQKKMDG